MLGKIIFQPMKGMMHIEEKVCIVNTPCTFFNGSSCLWYPRIDTINTTILLVARARTQGAGGQGVPIKYNHLHMFSQKFPCCNTFEG